MKRNYILVTVMKDEEEKLLGDEVEEILHKMGADKAAKLYEEMTDQDCGCEGRKQWLNNLHKKWKEGRLHYYDADGWEVEQKPRQWFRNFFRRLCFTRKLEWKWNK